MLDHPLDVAAESFELHVPPGYRRDVPHGILVWISADPSGAPPRSDWKEMLERLHLLWAGPNVTGNDRDVAVRVALALHAVATVASGDGPHRWRPRRHDLPGEREEVPGVLVR